MDIHTENELRKVLAGDRPLFVPLVECRLRDVDSIGSGERL